MGSPQTDSRLESELEIARRIQASFLPEALPEFPGWEIAARFQPARHVSGDFYDAFPLIQNRRLALVIGDVCDKGVGAALFMALFRTLIRAFAQQHYALRWMQDSSVEALFHRPMAEGRRPTLPSTGSSALINAMELTNEYIVNTHGTSGMFATLFVGVLDPKSGQLLFANGGHEYPILVNSTGIKSRLDTTGPLVGVFPGAQFELQSVDIEPGDILVACTDGVTEARSSSAEFFGRERLYALMEQPASTADQLLDRIQASVQKHMNGAEPSDDITLLAVRRQ